MGERPTITATPEQWRVLFQILVDHDVQQVAGKMFAIPEVCHFVEEICKLFPELE